LEYKLTLLVWLGFLWSAFLSNLTTRKSKCVCVCEIREKERRVNDFFKFCAFLRQTLFFLSVNRVTDSWYRKQVFFLLCFEKLALVFLCCFLFQVLMMLVNLSSLLTWWVGSWSFYCTNTSYTPTNNPEFFWEAIEILRCHHLRLVKKRALGIFYVRVILQFWVV
jgi:hypothetical protein